MSCEQELGASPPHAPQTSQLIVWLSLQTTQPAPIPRTEEGNEVQRLPNHERIKAQFRRLKGLKEKRILIMASKPPTM